MPFTSALAFKLGCALLGVIFGIFEVEYGVSLYQDVLKPASRFSSVVAVPEMAKFRHFFAEDRVLESPMMAPNVSNTGSDLSSNGTMITNETALSLLELAFDSPAIALVDRLDNTTTEEETSCPFARPEPLVDEPIAIPPFRLFVEIVVEILTFLLYHVLNAELQLFAFWLEKLELFAPIWVWEGELKARLIRCLDLLLALAPLLSWTKHAAIVDELEERLNTEHEETVLGIHAGYQLVIEAKDAEINDLRQDKVIKVAEHENTVQGIHAGYQQVNDVKDAEIRLVTEAKDTEIKLITEAKDTEINDLRKQAQMTATKVEESNGLLIERLKTIDTYKEKLDGMLTETSTKSKRILELEENQRRSQTQHQTQMKTFDDHLLKDGWKMTTMGLRPLASPPGPPSSRIPAPQFGNNGPHFNPGAPQFVPRPAPFVPQSPHHQPNFRGPQVDPRFMGH